MERNISETPERWVVLKLPNNFYKIFGTWYGGYLTGDRWKLNSGVKSVDQDDEFYYFNGFSGSCYKCRKSDYGVATSYGNSVLSRLLEHANGEIDLMDDVENWREIIK